MTLDEENTALKARVAELEALVERLEQLADSDTLTPLPNRRFFVRAVERAIAQGARHGTPAAVLFVDVDRLKDINDAFGHAIGDAALVAVAWALGGNVRSSDVVARIGGDEFGVLLDYADQAAARDKAAALAERIAETPFRDGIDLTVSIGVTALQAGDTAVSALARADAEMYRIKRRFR